MINFILRPGDRFENLIKIIDPNDSILPKKTNQLRLTMNKETGEIYVVRFLLNYRIEKIKFNDDKISVFSLTTKAYKSFTLEMTGLQGEFTNRINSVDFVDPRTVHKFIKELDITTILRIPIRLTAGPGYSIYHVIPEANKELLENYVSIPDLIPGARYYYKDPSKPNI